MNSAAVTKRIDQAPRASTAVSGNRSSRSTLVGAYYVLTILAGAFLLFFHGRLAFAADVIASAVYLAVTALFWASALKDERQRRLR